MVAFLPRILAEQQAQAEGESTSESQSTSNKYTQHPIFNFPETIGNDEYKDWMRFGVVQFEGTKGIDRSRVDFSSITSTTDKTRNSKVGVNSRSVIPISNTKQKLTADAKRVDISNRPTKINRRNKTFSVSADIILPMPQSLSVNNTVAWDNAELGFIGGAIRGGLDPTNLKNSIADTIKATSGGAVFDNIFTSVKSKLANFLVGVTGANGQVVNETANRFILNPHAEVLFKGVDFRKFQFQWKLTPRSENEVNIVRDIIQMFKFHSAPDISSDTNQNFIVYPDEFQIQFMHLNSDTGAVEDNLYLPRISQCILTDVATNYTSVGLWSAFKSGAPVEVELSLSFSEVELITKQRIDEGF